MLGRPKQLNVPCKRGTLLQYLTTPAQLHAISGHKEDVGVVCRTEQPGGSWSMQGTRLCTGDRPRL